MSSSLRSAIWAVVIGLCVVGCGQKGPLFLPDDERSAAKSKPKPKPVSPQASPKPQPSSEPELPAPDDDPDSGSPLSDYPSY